ncbi:MULTISPECIES: hypothetical protein [unclassified Ensifer]
MAKETRRDRLASKIVRAVATNLGSIVRYKPLSAGTRASLDFSP